MSAGLTMNLPALRFHLRVSLSLDLIGEQFEEKAYKLYYSLMYSDKPLTTKERLVAETFIEMAKHRRKAYLDGLPDFAGFCPMNLRKKPPWVT